MARRLFFHRTAKSMLHISAAFKFGLLGFNASATAKTVYGLKMAYRDYMYRPIGNDLSKSWFGLVWFGLLGFNASATARVISRR